MAGERKKERRLVIVLSLVVLVLLILSVVSPFWLTNLINKITGKVVIVDGATCIDNDGGDNPALKGSVEYNNPDMNNRAIYTDKCQDGNKRLKEYYCGIYANVIPKLYSCDNGCRDGACK